MPCLLRWRTPFRSPPSSSVEHYSTLEQDGQRKEAYSVSLKMPKRIQSDEERKGPAERSEAKRFKFDVGTASSVSLLLSPPKYDFQPLIKEDEQLRKHTILTSNGQLSIDFKNRAATLCLTRAILKHHFNLTLHLDLGQLIPTIPNRVQYLQWAFSLLQPPAIAKPHTMLDIGTGPCCIYAMLAARLFPSWSFLATDTDANAITSALRNVRANDLANVSVVATDTGKSIFPNSVRKAAPVLTVCNPPFHEEMPQTNNLPGTQAQLSTQGGEETFIRAIAEQSLSVPSVHWFTTLVGRKIDVSKILAYLQSVHINATQIKHVQLSPGGKTVRWAIAWSFGSEISECRVESEGTQPWRFRVMIQPGRQFANQLTSSDITDICTIAMLDDGWFVCSPSSHTDGATNAVVRLRAAGDCDHAGGEIVVQVVAAQTRGHFIAHVKAEKKGIMTPCKFESLGTQIADEAVKILNEAQL